GDVSALAYAVNDGTTGPSPAAGYAAARGTVREEPGAALSEPGRNAHGAGGGERRDRWRAHHHASELTADTSGRFLRRNLEAANATRAGENLRGQIAHNCKPGLWSRRGPRFPGYGLGRPAGQCRIHRGLGRCRKIHAG